MNKRQVNKILKYSDLVLIGKYYTKHKALRKALRKRNNRTLMIPNFLVGVAPMSAPNATVYQMTFSDPKIMTRYGLTKVNPSYYKTITINGVTV